MNAQVGDRIVIKGHHIGEPDRDGEILEVVGSDGGPPSGYGGRTAGTKPSSFPDRTPSCSTSSTRPAAKRAMNEQDARPRDWSPLPAVMR